VVASGDDTLTGSEGTDTIDGGAGAADVAIYAGLRSAYNVTAFNGVFTVSQIATNVSVTVTNVETLKFDDASLSLSVINETNDTGIVYWSDFGDTITMSGNGDVDGFGGDDTLAEIIVFIRRGNLSLFLHMRQKIVVT